ncbi:hypothetical protein A3715_00035 [Oleiphilus sp. HI0009]|nr:hypothetical protein A3715_00035 [Oleiphilus sp. HI0009]
MRLTKQDFLALYEHRNPFFKLFMNTVFNARLFSIRETFLSATLLAFMFIPLSISLVITYAFVPIPTSFNSADFTTLILLFSLILLISTLICFSFLVFFVLTPLYSKELSCKNAQFTQSARDLITFFSNPVYKAYVFNIPLHRYAKNNFDNVNLFDQMITPAFEEFFSSHTPRFGLQLSPIAFYHGLGAMLNALDELDRLDSLFLEKSCQL